MNTTNKHNLNAEAFFLQMAIDTIRLHAITEKVGFVRTRIASEELPKVIVRYMSPLKMVLRIAAAVIVILSSATLYKLSSVSTQSIYNQTYMNYELSTNRGGSIQDDQAEAYINKNWQKVIELNAVIANPTNKSLFLTGASEMELHHFANAIAAFQPILDDKNKGDFRDESEYYTAMACLATNQIKKGFALLDQIRANPDHIYYPLVSRISDIDLKIIALIKK